MEYMERILRLLILLMLVLVNGCYGCWDQERIALLQLKASINHPNGSSLSSWDDLEGEEITDCCEWEGVECNITTHRVIKLSLNSERNYELGAWYLNTSVFLPFESLISLDLNHNVLHGCIENEGFEKLSRLSNLQILDLSFNHFNNSILSSLNGLSSLKALKLRGNYLIGQVYIQDFDGLKNLKELDISFNGFDSIVAKEGLPSLKTLSMIRVRNITIHSKELQKLRNMENLYLDYATLSNDFLPSIQVMTSLKVLSLRGCGLTGTLPFPGARERKSEVK